MNPTTQPLGAPSVPRQARLGELTKATPLQLALLASVALHALLLLAQLATPGSAPRRWMQSKLDIVLVNARDEASQAPAQALAQAALRGGGDGAPGERALSPLLPSEALSLGDSPDEARQRLHALRVQQQQLLTGLRRDLARLPPPDPTHEAQSTEGRELAERRRLLLTQMAELERRVNERNAPPRQRYVSPATQEVAYARYYDGMRRRIEARGTRDFPVLNGRKLYGQLTMNISVDASGRLREVEVVEPSGTPGLDLRAQAIVRAAAPFGAFSKAMRKEAEVLVMSARFTFDRDKGLQTEVQDGTP